MSPKPERVNARRVPAGSARAARLVLSRFMPYRLSVTANLVSAAIASTYEDRFGLRVPEWRVVAVLGEDSAENQQALCEATRMDKMTVSRAVASLRARRLVRQEDNVDDKRARSLTLTPSGRAMYASVAPAALELEKRLLDGFSRAERATLEGLLRRLEAAAQELGATTG